MASIPNVVFVPSLLNADTLATNIATATAVPRVAVAPFPLNLAGSGNTDPVGPQRWPVKL